MMSNDALPLIGRSSTVSRGVDRALEGLSTMVVGPAGSGKSRVVDAIADELQRRQRRVGRLTGTASIAVIPFAIFLGLLAPETSRRIAQLDPLGRAALVRAAIHDLELDAIVLDEASLLDPASAAFLLELAQAGVAVIASVTSGSRTPDAVQVLSKAACTASATLGPLPDPECAELVTAMLRGPVDAGAVRSLVRGATGHVGMLREAVREALADGALRRSGDLWRLAREPAAPRSLRQSLDARLKALDPAMRQWITAVAVADQVPMDVAVQLAPPEASDRAEREGWVALDPERDAYRIRQQAWRRALVGIVGRRTRLETLRLLVTAFEAVTRPLTEVERAAIGEWRLDLREAIAPEEALELARLTSVTAPVLCERLLREAVARGGGAPAEVALAEQLKRAGRIDESEGLLGAARPDDRQTFAHLAATLAIVTGIARRRSAEALSVLDAQIDRHGPDPDLLAVRVGLLLRERRLAEATALSARLTLPRRPGFAPVFAGIHEALLAGARGDLREALHVVAEVREQTPATTDRIPEGPVTMDWLSGFLPAIVGLDVQTAAPIAERNYDRMVETGMHAARTQFAHLLGVCRIQQGDPGTAAHLLQEAEESVGIWHDSWLPRIVASRIDALLLTGQTAAAKAAYARLETMPRTDDHAGVVDLAAAHLTAREGHPAEAAALARAVARRAHAHGAVVEAFDALHAAVRYGDVDACHDLLELGPLPDGAVRNLQRAHARALLDHDEHALDDVARRLWAIDQRLLAIEIALEGLGRNTGRGDQAAAAARQRLAMWLLQTPTLDLGERRPDPGASALTTREREIALLASQGFADRAIASQLGISVRTAQTHLGRAFGKLGIHRREALSEHVHTFARS